VALAADALSGTRLVAALAFPRALTAGGWLPLGLVTAAIMTDVGDGRLARRLGAATRHGAVLDNVADVVFVLGGTAAAATAGRLAWAVPVAIAVSVGAYAAATAARSAAVGRPELARSSLGHTAGVINYAVVAVVAGSVAWPASIWGAVLRLASVASVTLNLAAAAAHALGSIRRAHAPRAEGTRAR
jgi:phosphatidylglycerophosphate synthase